MIIFSLEHVSTDRDDCSGPDFVIRRIVWQQGVALSAAVQQRWAAVKSYRALSAGLASMLHSDV